jgi:uncharacterized protein YbjT (DUF2867 family)
MKYVLSGSLGNITKPLAEKLIAAKHDVTIISSHDERRKSVEQLGAKAAIGDLDDAAFLKDIYKGADAVYTMVPPKMNPADWKREIRKTGHSIASAIKAAGVRKVVNLSSIGAHMPVGCGPVSALYFVEQELNALEAVDVKHLRPGFFYTNFFGLAGMIKHAGIWGNNYGAGAELVMVHPSDIAVAAAGELTDLSFIGNSVRYIVDDIRNSREIASVLGSAIGKPDLPYVEFTDEQAFQGMLQSGMNEETSLNFVEMGQAVRHGDMFSDFKKQSVPKGKIKMEDFAKEFAAAY